MTSPKLILIAALAALPTIVFASEDGPSFSCSSSLVVSLEHGYQASCDGDFSFDNGALLSDTLISITASGQLNVGEQAILTAPNIRLSADDVIVQGRLNALGGTIDMSSASSVEFSAAAIVDLRGSVLPKPLNINNDWGVQLADPPRGAKVDLLPRVVTTNEFGTFASGNIVLGGSGIRPQALQSVQQGGQLVLLGSATGSIIQLAEAALPSNGFVVSQVPEPSNLSMLAMGLFGISLVARRKAKQH